MNESEISLLLEKAITQIALDLDFNDFTTERRFGWDTYVICVKLKDGTKFDVKFPADMVERYQEPCWLPPSPHQNGDKS